MTLLRRRFLQSLATLLPATLLPRSLRADTPAPTAAPKPLSRDQDRYGPKRTIPNGTSTFKVSTRDCRGDFFAMEHNHTARGGPFRHTHTVEDEWFYVLEGEYRVEIGGTLYTLHPGDSILGPRGIPHAFAFVGPASGRMLITYAPGGRMEEFFTSQDQHGGRRYDLDPQLLATFGLTRTGPPLAVD